MAKQTSSFLGQNTSESEKKYERITKTVPARHDRQFGLGVVNGSNHTVRVSTVLQNSIASGIFEVKDKIVLINGVEIVDKAQLRQLILSACSSAPDFEVVIDRPRKDKVEKIQMPTAEPVVEIPDLSFLTKVKKEDSERGNPMDGFQYAPIDVREILQRRVKSIIADFMPPYKKVANPKFEQSNQQTVVDAEAHLTHIASDVPPDKQLMKPRK